MSANKTLFTIGALYRRSFRRACMSLGISYSEEKGWLDSLFVVSGSEVDINTLTELAESYKSYLSEDRSW